MDVTRMMRPLLGVTAGSVLLAGLALLFDRPVNAVAPPRVLLADFAPRIDQAKRLEVTHGLGLSGAQTMVFVIKDAQWVMPQRGDYPANQELVNETLLALADVKAVAARTAQKKWHKALGLVVPEDLGRAVRFRVLDENGTQMTSLLLGQEEASETEAAQDVKTYGVEQRQFYVRREAEDQSWLARGRLPRNPNIAAWMDAHLPKGDIKALKSVGFGAADETIMVRVTPDSWSMAGGAAWTSGFAALRPEDVADAASIEFATAQPMVLTYQDGLTVTYENVGAATVIWTRISATAKNGASAATKKMAARINARFGGWALRFAADQAPVLLPGRAQLSATP